MDPDYLNRIGIVLCFFSFWFAAPEIFGEQKLKEWETHSKQRLERTQAQMPSIVNRIELFVAYTGVIIAFVFWIIFAIAVKVDLKILPVPTSPFNGYLIFGLLVLLLPITIKVLPVVSKIPSRWLQFLAGSSAFRRLFLIISAHFFVIGTAMQFFATFVKK